MWVRTIARAHLSRRVEVRRRKGWHVHGVQVSLGAEIRMLLHECLSMNRDFTISRHASIHGSMGFWNMIALTAMEEVFVCSYGLDVVANY